MARLPLTDEGEALPLLLAGSLSSMLQGALLGKVKQGGAALLRQRLGGLAAPFLRKTTRKLNLDLKTLQRARLKRLRGASSPGQAGGVRVLAVVLPNRRRIRLRVGPALASHQSLRALHKVVDQNTQITSRALKAQARAIERLRNLQEVQGIELRTEIAAAEESLGQDIAEARSDLGRSIARLRRQSRAELSEAVSSVERTARRLKQRNNRQLRDRIFWDGLLLATALPFFSTHGDRRSLTGTRNLLLGGGLAATYLAKDALGDSTLVGALAPVAFAGAAQAVLGGRQTERFVAGSTVITLDLSKRRAGSILRGQPLRLGAAQGLTGDIDLRGRPIVSSLEGGPALESLLSEINGVMGWVEVTGPDEVVAAVWLGSRSGSEPSVHTISLSFVIDTEAEAVGVSTLR
jgi:hypothetical protein